MDKLKLQPLKGFRDFLPEEVKKRNYALDIIKKTFDLYGFEPLETPALEYKELLAGKYGEESNKLMYSFKDLGGRDVALRYDQTVPTARILAMYHQTLPMPFRRYQIQNVWRAENPQAGRFREFLQCDADIYGSYSPLADAEVIALANDLYENLGFKDFIIYINDRKILFQLMEYASIPQDLHLAVIAEIDKLDRKTNEEVFSELRNKGLSDSSIKHLFHHLDEAKPTEELLKIIDYSKSLGVREDRLNFQARLARGLDYYTSTIFEIKIKDYKAGSVLGGGRYDKLIGQLSDIEVAAVGFAVGFDRTMEAMEQFKLFPQQDKHSSVLVAVFNKKLAETSAKVVEILRRNEISAEIFPEEDAKLEKQIKYADKKGIRWFVVIGPDEKETEKAILKDLKTGKQEDIDIENLIKKIKNNV